MGAPPNTSGIVTEQGSGEQEGRDRVGFKEGGISSGIGYRETTEGTDHARGLDGLRHAARVGLAPEHVALKVLVARVHDEGERVHVSPHAHERQETYPALH